MGWKLLGAFVVLMVLGAGALAFYGANVSPTKHNVEEVLPDNKFPK
jgi:hypothetical protein